MQEASSNQLQPSRADEDRLPPSLEKDQQGLVTLIRSLSFTFRDLPLAACRARVNQHNDGRRLGLDVSGMTKNKGLE